MDENKITVKICGLKSGEDVKICARPGVDVLGFVVEYPLPVPWNLRREEAAALLPLVPPSHKTCLVSGGPPEKLIALAESLRPSMMQLHFKETLAETEKIARALLPLSVGVIKTIPPTAGERMELFGTSDAGWIARALCEAGVSAILVDSRAPANAAGEGEKGDVELFKQVKAFSLRPVILAGGINAENVGEILAMSGARHIDLMSGAESAPGVKDGQKVAALLTSLGVFFKGRGEERNQAPPPGR
ncbi:MAG: phosphoribosylanthranilate isomerase [Clostridiales bacterium]|nr:phosphoribosylanthranilate isomerase [Clostridiales bacterium]